ncbi:DUF4261 domain-containing protein [Bradyrhizobium sp.]|uniref:DUF4261 domain-containing protein n=1 Tax=Bradyrhizobium sp. TaxID=376 RepID=UPI0023A59304|nr:DUF4261 domain-containing protein [Bradyrhizobium sp.]MDE2377384.1 DUF4261 domain-containing protein [Bradyrhizobium sp.]
MSNPLALVLLEKPVTPDMSAVTRALHARHPELRTEFGGREDQSPAGSPLIRCGDHLVAVMSMPAPIPEDAGLWSRTTTTWPDGKMVAARHRGHLIVSALGQGEKRLPAARTSTAVVGALIAAIPECCGVVWDAKVARPARLWLDMSRQSFAPFPDYPFTLWVDILPFRTETGIGAVTMGLSAFAGREIEFETEKLTLRAMLDKVAGLAAYLVEHGPVVSDGDTIGSSETERFTVRHMTSPQFSGLPVLFVSAATA